MGRTHLAGACLTLGLLAGCGASRDVIIDYAPAPAATCSPVGTVVNIDYATSEGGAATPVLAAERFARHGGVQDLVPPVNGWTVRSSQGRQAVVGNGNWQLSAQQGSDRGWLIDEVRCVRP